MLQYKTKKINNSIMKNKQKLKRKRKHITGIKAQFMPTFPKYKLQKLKNNKNNKENMNKDLIKNCGNLQNFQSKKDKRNLKSHNKQSLSSTDSTCCNSIKETEQENFLNELKFQISLPIRRKQINTFQQILNSLECKQKPKHIMHREKEYQQIKLFLIKQMTQAKKQNLFISGTPGAGKTLLISQMLKDIMKNPQKFFKSKKEKFIKPIIIELNAMTFKTPITIFDAILKKLTKELPLTFKEKLKLLKDIITNKEAVNPIFLFIDELDNLFKGVQHNEEIMFEIFNLTEYPDSRIVTIGISNSIDLIVKLSQKKKIPLPKMKHLVFNQYQWKDLFDIVKQRLLEIKIDDFNVFEQLLPQKGLELCTRKLYNKKGGDIRHVLDLCRVAIQKKINDIRKSPNVQSKITFQELFDVKQNLILVIFLQIVEEQYGHKDVQIIKDLSGIQQLFLIAIYRTFSEYAVTTYLHKVVNEYNELYQQWLAMRPPQNQIKDILTTLEDYSLVSRKLPQGAIKFQKASFQKLKLQIPRNSIKQALRNDAFFAKFLD